METAIEVKQSRVLDERAGDEAFTIKTRVCQRKREIGKHIFALGEDLRSIKTEYLKDPEYGEEKYGFKTFFDLCEASEQADGLGMSSTAVNRAIRLYETYVLKLNLEPHAVLEIVDYSKLDTIRALVAKQPENAEEWLNQAKVLKRSALDQLVKAYRKDNPALDGAVPEGEIGTVQDAKYLTAKEFYQAWRNLDEWLLKIFMRKSTESYKAGEEIRQMMETLVKLQ